MNLMTTGNGTVRFNPNLYNNGKVCLSLLGTWRGGATGSENWTKDSTLWQVLVSIQSAILGSEFPYFNEPGVESQWGTEQGELQKRIHSNGGYERLRVATIQHAMVAHLRSPPPGFEEIVRRHFRVKKRHILAMADRWLDEAKDSDTKGHFKSLQKQASELREELDKLGDDEQVEAAYVDHTTKLKELPSSDGDRGDLGEATEDEDTGFLDGEDESQKGDASLVEAELLAKADGALDGAVGSLFTDDLIGHADELAAALDDKTGVEDIGKANMGEGAIGADQEFESLLQSMKDMFPGIPEQLLSHALNATRDTSTGILNIQEAINWYFSQGEQYLNQHSSEIYGGKH
eukprot:CAMPEP_0202045222 /NCGR_PEP_ID=MMETSP0963-20130614/566_1 /ASSEMBLY_ACC=CAM_ASM_000494 /TAXON_ID=4773 /ORGANISM="Schizochytrium aggregatum, Strain ATCC28209" /LENGTH=346 /DNA_ID=CAMNT_0048609789 /DNA_START=89 /DNA_END=1129 /DNA_ORIENTATION=-